MILDKLEMQHVARMHYMRNGGMKGAAAPIPLPVAGVEAEDESQAGRWALNPGRSCPRPLQIYLTA